MPSKLHIPGPGGKPLCGRQLVNDRSGRTQTDSGRSLAATLDQYMAELVKGKACRHCGREAGILPRIIRTVRAEAEEDNNDE